MLSGLKVPMSNTNNKKFKFITLVPIVSKIMQMESYQTIYKTMLRIDEIFGDEIHELVPLIFIFLADNFIFSSWVSRQLLEP